jgi:hypothetical protein
MNDVHYIGFDVHKKTINFLPVAHPCAFCKGWVALPSPRSLDRSIKLNDSP